MDKAIYMFNSVVSGILIVITVIEYANNGDMWMLYMFASIWFLLVSIGNQLSMIIERDDNNE